MGMSVIALLTFLFLKVNGDGVTNIYLYEDLQYKGEYASFAALEETDYYDLRRIDDHASSGKVTRGSCALLWEHGGASGRPSGRMAVIGYPQYDYPDLGSCCGLDNSVSAVSKCNRTLVAHNCPNGTFVKKFSVHNDGNMLSYLSMECFLPSNNTNPSAIMASHTSHPSLTPLQCVGAVRGTSFLFSGRERHVCYDVKPHCRAEGTSQCGHNEALCGFTATVENETNLLKELSIQCCNVGDPSEVCYPTDNYVTILECDALNASASMECSWSQTVGFSNSSSKEDGASTERQFYWEVGGEIGFSGKGLAASFGGKLGKSETTGFNWGTASSSTWNVATTVTVKMEVPGCTKTILQQVLGSCSFFEVNVNLFKRKDTNCNGGQRVSMMYFDEDDGVLQFAPLDTYSYSYEYESMY